MMIIQNRRILEILKLFSKEGNTITGNTFSNSLGVSSKTVRKDMRALMVLLKDKGAHIISKTGQGYTLVIDDYKKYDNFVDMYSINKEKCYKGINIVPFYYDDRISFIIIRILINFLHNKMVNQEELADELFISLSTLKKYLKDIKNNLSKFNIKLITNCRNGIKIEGNEMQIRYCMSAYIFNHDNLLNLSNNKFVSDIFPKAEIDTIKDIVLKIILKHNIHLTDVAFKNLLVHIIITMRRAIKKNTVEYNETQQQYLQKSNYFIPASEILNAVNVQLGVDISNEVYYLTQHFIASQKFIESAKSRDDIFPLVNDILKSIEANTEIDLSIDNELISGLMIHLIAAISRLKFNMNIKNDILKTVKDNYPLAFEMAVLAAEVLEKKERVKTNENEIGFLAIHFGASLERNKLNTRKIKRAIIVCSMGLSTALLVKSKLQRHFGENLHIEKVMSCYELTLEEIKKVDFVFSTVPVAIDSSKIVRITPIMSEADLLKVEKRINRISNKHIINYKNFFKKDLFFPALKAKSAYEVIDLITNKMIKKQYIDEKIRTIIINREKLSSTEIGQCIAIPHALDKNIKEACVAVAVLDRPIIWYKEYVQLVFLLCIPKNLNELWSGFFEILFEKFIEAKLPNKWLVNRGFEEIINKFEESEKYDS